VFYAYQPVQSIAPAAPAIQGSDPTGLKLIRQEVESKKSQGEVLFLDQRQLLTFGAIQDVPLVDDYEKKYLMDQALSNEAVYFEEFYQDLANKRFSLIISEPLKVNLQGSSHQFGEENDAWVKWVAGPLLCYYEPIDTLKGVKVQLLVPRTSPISAGLERYCPSD